MAGINLLLGGLCLLNIANSCGGVEYVGNLPKSTVFSVIPLEGFPFSNQIINLRVCLLRAGFFY